MTLSPDRVGDKGQRYEVRVEGYPKDGWNVIGWSDNEDGALRMATALKQAPGARRFRIWDRVDECYTLANKFDQEQSPTSEDRKALALAAVYSANLAAAVIMREVREGDFGEDTHCPISRDEDVLEHLLDAVKLVMEIEDDYRDERGQVYGAIRNFLEGWA